MLTSVSIRRADPNDSTVLTEFSRLVARDLSSHDWEFALDEKTHFIDLAEDERLFAFVCAGQPEHPDVLPEGTGEIFVCLVDPERRRLGIGRKLMIRAVTVLKRRGFERAFIWLPNDEVGGVVAWAVSLGFELSEYERALGGGLSDHGYLLDLDSFF